MKKVLIISYYWPPCGGAGVQRWVKFAKYLPQFGWEPTVYTPENPEMPVLDHSLEKDVENVKTLKQPIWEPYSLYKKFTGQNKDTKIQTGFLSEKKKPAITEKISVWLRGNLFIPDARKFWIKPSVGFLTKYLRDNPVDVIVSTGPPHSMHLIALGIKEKINIPWLADFRDPWTNIDYYKDLLLSGWADRLHHKLERDVLKTADKVITVSHHWSNDLEKIRNKKVDVITNGFDENDFNLPIEIKTDNSFTIAHVGSLFIDRNPYLLWDAIAELCGEVSGFKKTLKLKFVGKTDYEVLDYLDKIHLTACVEKINYLSHDEIIKIYKSSQVLLLLLSNVPNYKGHIPGKTFEYLASGRPILLVGPADGDASNIVNSTKAGKTAAFDNKRELKNSVKEFYLAYLDGTLKVESENISQFSRKNLTRHLATVLNEMII